MHGDASSILEHEMLAWSASLPVMAMFWASGSFRWLRNRGISVSDVLCANQPVCDEVKGLSHPTPLIIRPPCESGQCRPRT